MQRPGPHRVTLAWAITNVLVLAANTLVYGGFGGYLAWQLVRVKDPQPHHIGFVFVAVIALGCALASGLTLYGQIWVMRRLRRRPRLERASLLILALGTGLGGALVASLAMVFYS